MRTNTPTAQLGFDTLLEDAATANSTREFERSTGHLPGTFPEALPYYHALLDKHHAAMLAADVDETMRLRKEADSLALRLNHGEPGILAGPDASGCALARETAAAPGNVPLWGQKGSFIVTVCGARVRIEMDGIFGICASFCYWPGFSAHAIDRDRPFISQTGYRSFLGIHADAVPGMTPDAFVAKVLAAHVAKELKGRLVAIAPSYRERAGEAAR